MLSVRKKILTLGVSLLAAGIVAISVAQAATTGFLFPISDGAYSDFTPDPGGGTPNWQNVDDNPCNNNTDYNYTLDIADRDSYHIDLSSIPNGSNITQFEIKPCAGPLLTGAGTSTMKVFYRWNGSDAADFGEYVMTTLVTGPQQLTSASTTVNLSKGAGSTLEIGAVYFDGTRGITLGNIAVDITY